MPASNKLDNLRVVLVAARNPLNIGAAARAMSNFGFRHLRVVNPYEVAFRQARSAVGAADLLAQAEEYDNVAEAVADCRLVVGTTAVRHRELQHPLKVLKDGARIMGKTLQSSPVALLFGSERFGLSNDDLSHCHWLMSIPTREGHISMNLGQAVAICLYELVRETKFPKAPKENNFAAARELDRMTALLVETLLKSEFINARTAPSSEEKLRRMVRRLNLRQGDAELWLGMLRQILWKMNDGERNRTER
ncbi:MAG TPA: TrmJ/YjtD family RNA methyltransferase [Terriglobales bacterium]